MNRLKNYLQARQIAQLNLNEAARCTRMGDRQDDVNRYLIEAVRYLITANNNLQSLAFGVKPKKKGL